MKSRTSRRINADERAPSCGMDEVSRIGAWRQC
jgi:hypothetical protein